MISNRSDINSFLAMDVLREANIATEAGRDVIHMEVGQPAAPVPTGVVDYATAILAKGRLGYTNALGISPLRERIARYYQEQHHLEISPERIAVTTGSSGSFNLAFLAAFDVGAKIGLPSPGYPAYRNILKALGLVVVDIETGPEDRWTLSVEALQRTHEREKLDGILVASPANPSGTMLSPEVLEGICAFCDDLGIRFISDEIYHRLVFVGKEDTAARYSDNAIVVNSFSKYYCMTGWRIGWMVMPENLVRPIEKLAQNLFISAPELSQWAGIAAMDETVYFDSIRDGYAKNRAMIAARLNEIGLTDYLPVDGAFYFYVDVSRLTNDSLQFSRKMLEEINVATAPGADFDTARGARFLRMSFAGAHGDMKTAMDRINKWI